MSGSDSTPYISPQPNYTYSFYAITGQRLATLNCNGSNYPAYPVCSITGQNVYFGRKLIVVLRRTQAYQHTSVRTLTTTLNPGSGSAASTTSTQNIDDHGNLTQLQISDYTGSPTGSRTYNMMYTASLHRLPGKLYLQPPGQRHSDSQRWEPVSTFQHHVRYRLPATRADT